MIAAKICGVTAPEDAQLAVELGARAIGMVFWPGSPRAVRIDRAREIAGALPPFVTLVGVFVDQPVDEVSTVATTVGLDAIQLHGNETVEAYADTGRRTIKSVPVHDGATTAAADAVPADTTVLLDAHDPIKRGGTGRPIDWTIAAAIARRRPIILSGGLTPDNVAAAVGAVAPYAVDVSSGVESAPGRKDPAKLRRFFDALRTL